MTTAHSAAVLLVVIAIAAGTVSVAAQETTREHPYLFFTRADIAHLKERLQDPEIARIWAVVRRAALQRRSTWPAGTNVLCAGIAWQLTGDRRYAQAGIARVMEEVTSPRPWFRSSDLHLRYCDLTTSYRTWPIAYGYDMFHDVMTEQERQIIRDKLREHVFSPFMKAHAVHDEENHEFTDGEGHSEWWATSYANWNSQVNGAVGAAALATLDEIPEAATVLEMARASLRYIHPEHNQGEAESGGWDEGPMYWGAAVGFAARFYAALENVLGTDDGFFDLPGVQRTMQFAIDFASPEGKWVSFADCNDRAIMDPISALYILAGRYDNQEYVRHIDDNSASWHPLPLGLIYRPTIPTPPPEPRPRVRWYRDIHWAILCSDGLYLPFEAGDLGAAHGHLDANSMLLWVGGERMLNDPGYGRRRTEDHNCLLVNGEGQQRGPGSRNLGGHTTSFAKILQCGTVGDDTYLVSDATSCYGDRLVRYQRHVILARDGYVVVFDDAEAEAPAEFAVNWHTLMRLRPTGNNAATIEGTGAKLNVLAAGDSALEASCGRVRFDSAFTVRSRSRLTAWRLFTVLAPGRVPELQTSFADGAASVTVNGRVYGFSRVPDGAYRYDAGPVTPAPPVGGQP